LLQLLHQRFDRGLDTLDLYLNAAVVKISHSTEETMARCRMGHERPIPHTLHTPAHEHMRANRRLSRRLSHVPYRIFLNQRVDQAPC